MILAEYADAIKDKYITNGKGDIGERFEVYDALFHTGAKIIEHIGSHDHPCISVSGGSDSDCIVHLICTYFPEYAEKCRFVFVNTGLEYAATKRHLTELESKYGITIDKIRGVSVVTAVRKYGVPILNKAKAKDLDQYLRGTPKGEYRIFQLERISMYAFKDSEKELARYLKDNGIKVSAKCCDVSKKDPIYKYMNENGIDLNVSGERKAEGGQRSTSHKSCFEEKNHNIDKYMPLWWWSNAAKQTFKETEGIRYSDCYEVWGMKRTGCVGCPFGKDTAEELRLMHEYEPVLYTACMNVFGQAYELTDRFHCRRKKCLPEFLQLTITGEIERGDDEE